jgi:hypothetical protein
MSIPSGSIVEDGHEFRATPDVRAPSYSWSLAFLDHRIQQARAPEGTELRSKKGRPPAAILLSELKRFHSQGSGVGNSS